MLESAYIRLVVAYGGLRERATREEGQALVEYALIITLIAVVAISALQLTGTKVTDIFNTISNDI
jgi:Flp pilus assembly pilin Flp